MMSRAVPVIVGLTGSIGMGKSTASAWCRKVGIPVHDADACVHSLYGPGGAAVQPVGAAFPGVASDAGIDRAALSAAVAAAGRETALKTLEGIVHPLVTTDREAFVAQAAADGAWCVVLDIPLLFETMDPEARTKDFDALVVISAPAEIQRARVLARPGMTEEKFAFLLSKQVPDATKRAAADYVIETGFDSYAPARAQLAACFQALAAKHTEPYTRWMTSGMPLPPPRRLPPLPPPLLPPPATKIRAVTMDLDDTCWPTFPPILKASAALESDMAELLPRAAAAGT
jgi:dephospho-CoA kinase